MTDAGGEALARLRDEAMALIRATPALAAFAPVPASPAPADKPARTPSAVQEFLRDPGPSSPATAAFTAAAVAAAPYARWHQTYTEDEVGRAFLDHYAWMELWGPTGHFHCGAARAFVAFWGPGLYYDWHSHEAEEIYFLATGEADFHAQGAEDARIRAGETRTHASFQPHATTVGSRPILTLVLWRGRGLGDMARMQASPA